MRRSNFYTQFIKEKDELLELENRRIEFNNHINELEDKFSFRLDQYENYLKGSTLQKFILKDGKLSSNDLHSIEWMEDIELYCAISGILPKDLIELHIKSKKRC